MENDKNDGMNDAQAGADRNPDSKATAAANAISGNKTDANRRNAQLSTGPKTLQGKQNSRRNALKHGILAPKLLVTDGLGAEDSSACERLFRGLRRELEPVGELEEIMFEKIAISCWRLRRALQAEAASVRRGYLSSDAASELEEVTNPLRTRIKDHLIVPSSQDLNRILRYETTIDRQLAYAINQLERLQRSRKGENVPAPVTVQLSSDR